jgi:hypothetical protein
MSKIVKYFYLLGAMAGGACVFDGCFGLGGAGNIFSWGYPRAIWLWLSEDLITH